MIIKSLKLINFRAFGERTFTFGPLNNNIAGDNGQGKSSIAEGIVFALYGVTIYGSNRCDPLIKQGADKAEAEIVISVKNRDRTIRRIKDIVKTEIILDGTKVSQKQIEKILSGTPAGLEMKQFMLMFNPMYHETVNNNDMRALITSLIIPGLFFQVIFFSLKQGYLPLYLIDRVFYVFVCSWGCCP